VRRDTPPLLCSTGPKPSTPSMTTWSVVLTQSTGQEEQYCTSDCHMLQFLCVLVSNTNTVLLDLALICHSVSMLLEMQPQTCCSQPPLPPCCGRCSILRGLYEQWEVDPRVNVIVLKSDGRAFCAGGMCARATMWGKRAG